MAQMWYFEKVTDLFVNSYRFEDGTQSLAEAIVNPEPAKRATFIFGAGRRICQGMHVAEVSLFLGISRILCMPEEFEVVLSPRSDDRAKIVRKAWEDERRELDRETEQWK